MKKPTLNGWLAIAGAAAAVILTIIVALGDKAITAEEAATIGDKTSTLINTIQRETAIVDETEQAE
jgi:hypothetical protein